jgi:two-component system, LytTR family, response regulator
MKKVVIIDDEPLARNLVKEYLQGHPDLTVAAECENGFEGVKAIASAKPDLVILDVQMPKISGFEMLELIDEVPPVIFATAFDEFAIRAFEANAIDYLLKPFSKERFDAAIGKWRSRTGTTSKSSVERAAESVAEATGPLSRLVVREGREIAVVSADEIEYIEAFDDYVKIFARGTFFLKKKTMGFYASRLDAGQFARVHRSYIINLKLLTRIEPLEKNSYVAILRDGKRIPVSRSIYASLKERLGI